MPIDSTAYDAIVIGGSYAGQSAALQLARARRRVLVIDAGRRRNRFAEHSHGFLGQDGRAPGDIVADARLQLLAYPTVTWRTASVTTAAGNADDFRVEDDAGQVHQARNLILATGVVDELPPITGLAERWGRSVFHCPYCHGYELDQGPIGVISVGPLSMHHALMLPDWGRVTFFLNDSFAPDEAQQAALHARGVAVEATPIACITDQARVMLVDGRSHALSGLFTATRTQPSAPFAEQLGCAIEEGPMGPYVRVDDLRQTTVAGVFACGDTARAAGSVALSVGDGAMAGVAAHRRMMFG